MGSEVGCSSKGVSWEQRTSCLDLFVGIRGERKVTEDGLEEDEKDKRGEVDWGLDRIRVECNLPCIERVLAESQGE